MPDRDDIKEGIAAYLLGIEEIASMVENRVYFSVLPQKAGMPSIVLTTVSSEPQAHLLGPSGVCDTWVQVDSYGDTNGQASKLDKRIRLALLVCPPPPMGGIVIHDVNDLGRRDGPIGPRDGSQNWLHRAMHDYRVIHDEAIP